MKRDMNVVRELLMQVESAPANNFVHWPSEGMTGTQEHWDVRLAEMGRLIDAGYIRGKGVKNASGNWVWFSYFGLTWEGADLIDTIRDERVWKSTIEKLKEVGGSVSLELLKTVATNYASKFLGLS